MSQRSLVLAMLGDDELKDQIRFYRDRARSSMEEGHDAEHRAWMLLYAEGIAELALRAEEARLP